MHLEDPYSSGYGSVSLFLGGGMFFQNNMFSHCLKHAVKPFSWLLLGNVLPNRVHLGIAMKIESCVRSRLCTYPLNNATNVPYRYIMWVSPYETIPYPPFGVLLHHPINRGTSKTSSTSYEDSPQYHEDLSGPKL